MPLFYSPLPGGCPLDIHEIPLDRKLRFGFGLLLSLLLLLALFSYVTVSNLVENTTWVVHTHEVIISLTKIFSDCQGVETGVRGYYIMGDEIFLQPYYDAKELVYKDIKNFYDLTQDNLAQQHRAQALRVACDEKINICEEIIRVRKSDGYGGAERLSTIRQSRMAMEKVRVLVGRAIAEENRLLSSRQRVAHYNVLRAKILLPTIMILCFVLMTSAYAYIMYQIESCN